jgi:hypothetical protein
MIITHLLFHDPRLHTFHELISYVSVLALSMGGILNEILALAQVKVKLAMTVGWRGL